MIDHELRTRANQESFLRMTRATPVLVDVRSAGEAVPGMTPTTILTSGPPHRLRTIAFTSAPQVRHLFLVAERAGLADTVAAALRDRVLTAVVGPVCGAALKERGVTPAVEAEKDTMGALIHAIAARLGQA